MSSLFGQPWHPLLTSSTFESVPSRHQCMVHGSGLYVGFDCVATLNLSRAAIARFLQASWETSNKFIMQKCQTADLGSISLLIDS